MGHSFLYNISVIKLVRGAIWQECVQFAVSSLISMMNSLIAILSAILAMARSIRAGDLT